MGDGGGDMGELVVIQVEGGEVVVFEKGRREILESHAS